MRVMALDIGERRIGVALSDPTAFLARPFGTLPGGGGARSLAKRLRPIIAEEDVGQLVVGLPLRMSGERGPEALSIEKLVADLKRMLDIPIVPFGRTVDDGRGHSSHDRVGHATVEAAPKRRPRRGRGHPASVTSTMNGGSETMQNRDSSPRWGDADGDR